ncbi:dihydrodipicolinate synthase family protein [Ktedonosporobacter rubrisoli]|uniref:Dihydrodipicolinate synthase family protein n=1 Tax=Ktedonosporobacter rubrisoli TaxID=2509675 RepID=A0A4P6K2S3_KTERU|nr:dihydrodipicolinate synthase family protein [Ktedonosporobacter rubrisoli]QBD82528.1 dihydrodipicolinate synthase family protein [Ktedonosporobacter rubrisoli]
MARFPGIYVAVITPFTEDDEVDYARLHEHVNWLIESGVHGLAPTGSCGEYASLADQERAQVVETIIRAAAGRVPVVVGVASPSTKRVVAWARHAKEAGAAGVMALPPINYRPTRAEVIAYYEAVASVGLPIIAYNNPYDTSTDLTPELLQEMAHIKELVAVKEFTGDVRRIPAILEQTSLEVLAGVDDMLVESLLAGATGWVAGLTNAIPRESVRLYDLVLAGELVEARRYYNCLLPLLRFDATPRLVQAIKHSSSLVGRPMGETRAPRLPLSTEERESVEAALKKVLAADK